MAVKGFLAVLVLSIIHLFANQAKILGWIWHGRFLSFAAGISFAYVFVDLLPALEQGQPVLKRTFEDFIPYFDRHAYLIALMGVLFYYGIHTQSLGTSKFNFWTSITGYLIFNFFVGATLSDSSNPDIQPLALYTFALGMHYFIRDHSAGNENIGLYEKQARWCLVVALFLGFIIGTLAKIPDSIIAIVISFLAGGILLNALRYELPKREQLGYCFFVLGSLFYTALVLSIGRS